MSVAKGRRSAAIPSDEPARQRLARPWRFLTAGGGLLVAATFFMPAIKSCGAPLIPAEVLASSLTDGPPGTGNAFASLLLFAAAYILGLCIAVTSIVRILRMTRLEDTLSYGTAGFIFTMSLSTLAVCALVVLEQSNGLGELLLIAITVLAAFLVMFFVIRSTLFLRHRAYLTVHFIGSLLAAIWFGLFAIGGLYGVRLSLLASLMMLVGTIGEGRVLTRRTCSARSGGWLLAD